MTSLLLNRRPRSTTSAYGAPNLLFCFAAQFSCNEEEVHHTSSGYIQVVCTMQDLFVVVERVEVERGRVLY